GIIAVYQGDGRFTSSTGVYAQLVNQDPTTTALSASPSPGVAGQPLTLTATVSPLEGFSPGFGPPLGTVFFQDGIVTIGTGTLSGGVATFTTTALTPGSHSLSAIYVGDSKFARSTAPTVTEVVNNPAPVVTGLSPATLPEGSAAFTLTLTGDSFVP